MSTAHRHYEELLSVSRARAHEKITAFCQPLRDLFNIDSFTYSHLTNDGNCLHIGLCPEALEDYLYSGQLLTSPTLSRFHYTTTPSVKIWEPLNETNEALTPICQYFQKNNLVSGISIIIQKETGRETYYFGMRQLPKQGASYWHDILPSLYEFIKLFSTWSKSTLGKFSDCHVALPALIGDAFYEDPKNDHHFSRSIEQTKNNYHQLLRKNLMDSKGLTHREISVIEECLLGKSSKQISQDLHIAVRTVENNIQNIKEKFGCKSQKELMLLFL